MVWIGCIQVSAIRRILTLSETDFQIDCGKTNMLLRAKDEDERLLWVNLLEFARQGPFNESRARTCGVYEGDLSMGVIAA